MKHLELHIIQSVPVSCLNRDDLNSPKTAVFGGVQRARVSSQSWKRAVREMAKEIAPHHFRGERTRLFHEPLCEQMIKAGLTREDAEKGARDIVDALVKVDPKSKDKVKSTTMYFMSPLELQTLAEEYAANGDVKKALKKVDANAIKDAADIALFGRMVANDHSLTVEAASMFSHALSTHRTDNEIDFFSAVDDLQPKDDAGAGMTSTLEFNSATYYRFAALNLDMLADDEHLGPLTREERQHVVRTFVEATIKAVPGARRNTMHASTLPNYVLGIVRESGHPVQLVNAFESPVRSREGNAQASIEALKKEYESMTKTWGLTSVFERAIPDVTMVEFVDGLMTHVD